MTINVNAAVIYYSSTGNVHALAEAAAEGAEKAGASVRLRKVHEVAPAAAIESNPAWSAHAAGTTDLEEAELEDLEWADAVILGTPTRYGSPASPLQAFIDTPGPLWMQGKLAGKVCTAFTSASTRHGGHERHSAGPGQGLLPLGRHHRAARLHRPDPVRDG